MRDLSSSEKTGLWPSKSAPPVSTDGCRVAARCHQPVLLKQEVSVQTIPDRKRQENSAALRVGCPLRGHGVELAAGLFGEDCLPEAGENLLPRPAQHAA